MSYLSVGDMAQTFLLRQHSAQMKTNLNRLTQELSSGRISDVAKSVAGDFSPLASIDHSLSTLKAYNTTAREAAGFVQAVQDTLDQAQNLSDDLAPALIMAGNSGHAALLVNTAADARQKFDALVSALNTRVGGRSLLAGTATDQLPLANPQTIISSLQVTISGQTTAAGIEAAVNSWFDTPGGGFDTVAYQGSTTPLAPFRISDGQQTDAGITAGDPALRELIKGFALAVLASDGVLSGKPEEQRMLLRKAGEHILSSQHGLSELRAHIGASQAGIETAISRNESEAASLEIARNSLLSADPYKTAGELEAVRGNLEMLYTLTARISRLSLANYLG